MGVEPLGVEVFSPLFPPELREKLEEPAPTRTRTKKGKCRLLPASSPPSSEDNQRHQGEQSKQDLV